MANPRKRCGSLSSDESDEIEEGIHISTDIRYSSPPDISNIIPFSQNRPVVEVNPKLQDVPYEHFPKNLQSSITETSTIKSTVGIQLGPFYDINTEPRKVFTETSTDQFRAKAISSKSEHVDSTYFCDIPDEDSSEEEDELSQRIRRLLADSDEDLSLDNSQVKKSFQITEDNKSDNKVAKDKDETLKGTMELSATTECSCSSSQETKLYTYLSVRPQHYIKSGEYPECHPETFDADVQTRMEKNITDTGIPEGFSSVTEKHSFDEIRPERLDRREREMCVVENLPLSSENLSEESHQQDIINTSVLTHEFYDAEMMDNMPQNIHILFTPINSTSEKKNISTQTSVEKFPGDMLNVPQYADDSEFSNIPGEEDFDKYTASAEMHRETDELCVKYKKTFVPEIVQFEKKVKKVMTPVDVRSIENLSGTASSSKTSDVVPEKEAEDEEAENDEAENDEAENDEAENDEAENDEAEDEEAEKGEYFLLRDVIMKAARMMNTAAHIVELSFKLLENQQYAFLLQSTSTVAANDNEAPSVSGQQSTQSTQTIIDTQSAETMTERQPLDIYQYLREFKDASHKLQQQLLSYREDPEKRREQEKGENQQKNDQEKGEESGFTFSEKNTDVEDEEHGQTSSGHSTDVTVQTDVGICYCDSSSCHCSVQFAKIIDDCFKNYGVNKQPIERSVKIQLLSSQENSKILDKAETSDSKDYETIWPLPGFPKVPIIKKQKFRNMDKFTYFMQEKEKKKDEEEQEYRRQLLLRVNKRREKQFSKVLAKNAREGKVDYKVDDFVVQSMD